MIIKKFNTFLSDHRKDPLLYLLVWSFLLFFFGSWWGVPNSESWLSDSFAPFQPLLGLTKLFSFGYMNKYPLVHQFILAVFDLPVVIVALVKSNFFEGMQVIKLISLIQSYEYASWIIMIDRLVSIAMGVGCVYLVYASAHELFSKRVGLWAAFFVTCNQAFNFYAHLAKVEVPYLFWALWGLYMVIRAVKYGRLRSYLLAAFFSTLCVGTKDQGYAIFIIPFVFYFIIYPQIFASKGENRFAILFSREMLLFALVFVVSLVLTQNFILNWEGFVYRFQILTGWNGTRSISYTSDFAGVRALFVDTLRAMKDSSMPLPILAASLLGVPYFAYKMRKDKKTLLLGMIFFFAGLSHYLLFVQFIKQSNIRFALPQSLFLTVYGALLIDDLSTWLWKKGRISQVVTGSVLTAAMLFSVYSSVTVNLNFLYDLRYEVEKWLTDEVEDESTIEYYAYLHYLPRFPRNAEAYRVKKRLKDVEKRKPDYIVLTSHYYPRFLGEIDTSPKNGRITTTAKNAQFKKSPQRAYLIDLLNGDLNYELVKRFNYSEKFFDSIGYSRISPREILVFKRK